MYHLVYSCYYCWYYFIDLYFISKLQGKSYKRSTLYMLSGIIVVYALVTPFLYDLSVNRGIISIINYVLLALPPFFLHLKISDAFKQGVGSIIYMMIIEMISSIPAIIILSISKVQVSNVVELYLNKNNLLFPIMISSIIIMVLLTFITLKIFTLDRIHTIFTYLLIPGIILLLLIQVNGFISNITHTFVLQCTIFVITFVLTTLLLYLYNKQLKNYAKLKAENNQAKLMQEMQNKQIEDINAYYKRIRKEDHDTNNHLRTINQLLESQSYAETIDYINHMLKEGSAL